jgi:hypothetical protein
MTLKTAGLVLAVIIAVIAAVLVLAVWAGHWRWQAKTERVRAALLAAGSAPIRPATYELRELEGLPPPVQRFFKAALTVGQPIVKAMRVWHHGEFNMSQTQAAWQPFTSSQVVTTQRPGFNWNGRIRMLPGLNVLVHDSYVAGVGALQAALLGWVLLADEGGSAAMAEGELMRYLAEAAWYPTALLPSQGVQWEAINADSARATLADGTTRVSLVFGFDAAAMISSVMAPQRQRSVGNKTVATEWRGRFWNHAAQGGMRVPLNGEVAWQLAAGPLPYWRGQIERIEYDFAR